MFENEPAWKQGDDCYIIWATLDCSNPEYVKKWNESSCVQFDEKSRNSQTESFL